eukprot:TRINITY_DN1413_c0_g1_i4.p1 TRINITY_DN1413_c0_g1~~TRINITY_DN1413_c0_g1_i4.p1  ORF type:complete len:218 (+),score=58.96 TRINITY_DN1413_c0_g1_i4:198-851(+)
MCIRDRYQRRVRGATDSSMASEQDKIKDENQHWFRNAQQKDENGWFHGEEPTREEAVAKVKENEATLAWFKGKSDKIKGEPDAPQPSWFKSTSPNKSTWFKAPAPNPGWFTGAEPTLEEAVAQVKVTQEQLGWFRGNTVIAWRGDPKKNWVKSAKAESEDVAETKKKNWVKSAKAESEDVAETKEKADEKEGSGLNPLLVLPAIFAAVATVCYFQRK